MQENPRFDDFLFTIVRETGGLEGLIHSFFSFLGRRTDFFYEADPGDKMGFPPGYAQRMLLSIMDVYQQEHYKKYPKKDPAEYAAKAKKLKEAKEKEKIQQEETKAQAATTQQTSSKSAVPSTTGEAKTTPTPTLASTETTQTLETQPVEQPKEEVSSVNTTEKPKDPKASSISTYNGASTEKYNWSQGISEVTVQIPIPPGTRAKNLIVDMGPTKLKVRLRTDNSTIVEGEWYERIKADDSTWSVDDDTIVFNLEKANENIWKTVLKGDQEIDATKVDNSKPIDSFDPETQGALRKIMYEQQRKQMGLPSSEEEAQLEMMKKAWDAEGSPFKGTPFDPSKFNLSGSNNMNFGGN